MRMCTWQIPEEEREAFPDNSNSSQIYCIYALLLLSLFPLCLCVQLRYLSYEESDESVACSDTVLMNHKRGTV